MEISQELKDLVIEEATNLKKYATADELAKLDFDSLNPDHTSQCIYGQMTGSCHSNRSLELISLCCERVYATGTLDPKNTTIGAILNGKPTEGRGYLKMKYYSPIELFIFNGQEKNYDLINFLKGETDTLTL